ncbi:hypothetical protein D3C87_2047540 [compost metagenome]
MGIYWREVLLMELKPPPTTEYRQRGLPIPLVSLPFIMFCVFVLGVGLGMGIA